MRYEKTARETLIKSLSDFIWIFIQSKESSDANSELFKEDDDEAMYKKPYEIRLCDLISVSLISNLRGASIFILMHRTAPALPIDLIEPAEPLSRAIKGRHVQGANLEV